MHRMLQWLALLFAVSQGFVAGGNEQEATDARRITVEAKSVTVPADALKFYVLNAPVWADSAGDEDAPLPVSEIAMTPAEKTFRWCRRGPSWNRVRCTMC